MLQLRVYMCVCVREVNVSLYNCSSLFSCSYLNYLYISHCSTYFLFCFFKILENYLDKKFYVVFLKIFCLVFLIFRFLSSAARAFAVDVDTQLFGQMAQQTLQRGQAAYE